MTKRINVVKQKKPKKGKKGKKGKKAGTKKSRRGKGQYSSLARHQARQRRPDVHSEGPKSRRGVAGLREPVV